MQQEANMPGNENEFIKGLISSEIGGKKQAIHAYDRMIWTVRSGFLTLVFAGWGLIIKALVENKTGSGNIAPYIFILSAFSLALAVGAYRIDLNYVRRKFRVIMAVNRFAQIVTTIDFNNIKQTANNEVTEFLKISGDTKNDSYMSGAYKGELMVSRIIYFVPSGLIIGIIVYYIF